MQTSRFNVKTYGMFQLKLPRRVVVVSSDGVLVDWRVICKTPTLMTKNNEPDPPDRTDDMRRPAKKYSEMVRDLYTVLFQSLFCCTTETDISTPSGWN